MASRKYMESGHQSAMGLDHPRRRDMGAPGGLRRGDALQPRRQVGAIETVTGAGGVDGNDVVFRRHMSLTARPDDKGVARTGLHHQFGYALLAVPPRHPCMACLAENIRLVGHGRERRNGPVRGKGNWSGGQRERKCV